MDIETAIENALNGDAILFLGSGASIGTVNVSGTSMLSASDLAKKIYPDVTDLQQATELFIEDNNENGFDGEMELISFLKQEFRCKTPLYEHRELTSINWKRIYTTNYDDIIETAYKEQGINIKSATTSSNIKECLTDNDLLYLHINGYINQLTKESLFSDFKLSSFSYNTDQFTNLLIVHGVRYLKTI